MIQFSSWDSIGGSGNSYPALQISYSDFQDLVGEVNLASYVPLILEQVSAEDGSTVNYIVCNKYGIDEEYASLEYSRVNGNDDLEVVNMYIGPSDEGWSAYMRVYSVDTVLESASQPNPDPDPNS